MKYLAMIYWKLTAYRELKHRVKLERVVREYNRGIKEFPTRGKNPVKIKPSPLYLFFHKYYRDIADVAYSELGLIK